MQTYMHMWIITQAIMWHKVCIVLYCLADYTFTLGNCFVSHFLTFMYSFHSVHYKGSVNASANVKHSKPYFLTTLEVPGMSAGNLGCVVLGGEAALFRAADRF